MTSQEIATARARAEQNGAISYSEQKRNEIAAAEEKDIATSDRYGITEDELRLCIKSLNISIIHINKYLMDNMGFLGKEESDKKTSLLNRFEELSIKLQKI